MATTFITCSNCGEQVRAQLLSSPPASSFPYEPPERAVPTVCDKCRVELAAPAEAEAAKVAATDAVERKQAVVADKAQAEATKQEALAASAASTAAETKKAAAEASTKAAAAKKGTHAPATKAEKVATAKRRKTAKVKKDKAALETATEYEPTTSRYEPVGTREQGDKW